MSIHGNSCLHKLAFSSEASENLINVTDFFKAQESYWISDIWITFNTGKNHTFPLSFQMCTTVWRGFAPLGCGTTPCWPWRSMRGFCTLEPESTSLPWIPTTSADSSDHRYALYFYQKTPNAPNKYSCTSHQAKRTLAFYHSKISAFKNDSLFQCHSHL